MDEERLIESAIRACGKIEDDKTRKDITSILKKVEEELRGKSLPPSPDVMDLLRDTTEKAKASLPQTESWQHIVLDHIPALVLLVDETDHITSVSNEFLRRFSYDKPDVLGKKSQDLVTTFSKTEMRERLFPLLETNDEVRNFPLKWLSKKGDVVEVGLYAVPQKDKVGKYCGAFVVLQDKTPFADAEQALQESEDNKRSILTLVRSLLEHSVKNLSSLRDKLPRKFQGQVESILTDLLDEELFQYKLTDDGKPLNMDYEILQWLAEGYTPISRTSGGKDQRRGVKTTRLSTTEVNKFGTLNFSVFDYEDNQDKLIEFALEPFVHFNLLKTFSIEEEKLVNLIRAMKGKYNDVPFHNFLHAIDVTQVLYYFLTEGAVSHYLTQLDILALLVGALGHDLDHPGLNNNYQEITKSPLALRFNNQSILENYHISNLTLLLEDPKNNIFESFSADERNTVQQILVSNILATDMKFHFDLLAKFNLEMKKIDDLSIKTWDMRLLLMKILTKCADVSNPIRPQKISHMWSKRLVKEFFNQGDLEKEAGLPLSAFMDRETTSIAKMQISFMDFIVKPLYDCYALVGSNIDECFRNLQVNRTAWDTEWEKEKLDREDD